jgi:hypothetical protein
MANILWKRKRNDSCSAIDESPTKKIRLASQSRGQSYYSRTRNTITRRSVRLLQTTPRAQGSIAEMASYLPPRKVQESSKMKKRRRYLAMKIDPTSSLASLQSYVGSNKMVFTHQIKQFRKIADEEVQLVVWRRESMPAFMTALADPNLPAYVLPKFLRTVEPGNLKPMLKSKTVKLAKAIGKEFTNDLIDDICSLTKAFAAALKVERVSVKLEHFGDNGCQFWHQDSVPYRLVATYRGPCTEWVHPDHGDATLRRRKENSKYKRVFAHNDVPLFKGRGSTFADDELLNHPGIVHRSPRILGSCIHRLVLILDLPDDDVALTSSIRSDMMCKNPDCEELH